MTAFITACVAAGIALFGELDMWRINGRLSDMGGDLNGSIGSSLEYRNELKDMYEQLCILGLCELANTDSDGKYVGNKYVRSDLLYYFDFNENIFPKF